MVIYLIVIGFLTYGYAKVSNCLAEYADKSAIATTTRSEAAAEDRAADRAERRLDEAERQRLAANDIALDRVLIAMGSRDRENTTAAFQELLKVRAETARQRRANDAKRKELAEQRARTEEDRREHPVPPPPSETC
jgi:hypothetical protein